MNWVNLAHAAYDKYREALGDQAPEWNSLTVAEKAAWVAAVDEACHIHVAACMA